MRSKKIKVLAEVDLEHVVIIFMVKQRLLYESSEVGYTSKPNLRKGKLTNYNDEFPSIFLSLC
jgi:hypothetical protein